MVLSISLDRVIIKHSCPNEWMNESYYWMDELFRQIKNKLFLPNIWSEIQILREKGRMPNPMLVPNFEMATFV